MHQISRCSRRCFQQSVLLALAGDNGVASGKSKHKSAILQDKIYRPWEKNTKNKIQRRVTIKSHFLHPFSTFF